MQLSNLDLTDFYHPVQNRKSSSKLAKPVVLGMRNASFEFDRSIKSEEGNPRDSLAANESARNDEGVLSKTDGDASAAEFSLENISFQVVS